MVPEFLVLFGVLLVEHSHGLLPLLHLVLHRQHHAVEQSAESGIKNWEFFFFEKVSKLQKKLKRTFQQITIIFDLARKLSTS